MIRKCCGYLFVPALREKQASCKIGTIVIRMVTLFDLVHRADHADSAAASATVFEIFAFIALLAVFAELVQVGADSIQIAAFRDQILKLMFMHVFISDAELF